MIRFFDVTLQFHVGGHSVQPVVKHIPALDAEDAGRKALATSTAKIARHHGHEVTAIKVVESE